MRATGRDEMLKLSEISSAETDLRISRDFYARQRRIEDGCALQNCGISFHFCITPNCAELLNNMSGRPLIFNTLFVHHQMKLTYILR